MHDDDEATLAARDPLPNRFTRSTALGCLGILGVLALPGFFLLPLDDWHLPQWVIRALGLVAFAALAGGVWLLVRVPATGQASDAWHPLTQAGRAPLREHPATRGNRAMLLVVGGLALLAAAGYVLASAETRQADVGRSVALAGAAGLCGAVLGLLVAGGRLPAPAWNWTRTPIWRGPRPQGIALALVGGAVTAWALLVAVGAGYAWGEVGLAALVLGSVLLPAVIARWPRGRDGLGGT